MDTRPVTGVSNSASYAAVLRLSRHRRGCILLDAPPNNTQPSTCSCAAHAVCPQPHSASLGEAVTTPWTTSQLPSSLCSVPTTHSPFNSQCDGHNTRLENITYNPSYLTSGYIFRIPIQPLKKKSCHLQQNRWSVRPLC